MRNHLWSEDGHVAAIAEQKKKNIMMTLLKEFANWVPVEEEAHAYAPS